jgi:azurin
MSNALARSKSKALLPLLLATTTVGLMLAACNKKEAAPAQPPVEISANDQMQYSTKTLEVKAGTEALIILTNKGTLAKEVMGHNFTLLKPGTDVAGYASKAMTAKDTEYQPASEAGSLVGHTKLLGPGESDTLRVTLAAGDYPYVCTFPGHFATMQGVLSAK